MIDFILKRFKKKKILNKQKFDLQKKFEEENFTRDANNKNKQTHR